MLGGVKCCHKSTRWCLEGYGKMSEGDRKVSGGVRKESDVVRNVTGGASKK